MHFKLILMLLLFSACNHSENKKRVKNTPPITIEIQPFSDVSEAQLNYVYSELKKIYPIIILKKAIELPKQAYYKERNRYRADTIIRMFNHITPSNHITIVLTNKDISSTKGTINDYGIMGLGYCPGKACVASTFRLNKENNLAQFFKVAIHELGHTQGLPHCPVKTCFMRDAEGKNFTNEEKEFCLKCKTHLISKGWAL